MAARTTFEYRLHNLVNREVERLVNEIAWIDSRLLELGETDEDEVEKRLLKILRKHLMRDLYELVGFVWDEYEEPAEEETYIESQTLEYAKIESVF